MSSDAQTLLDKGLSLWESDLRSAEKAFVDIYWNYEDTPEAELAQAYLYKLRNGDPRPEPSRMKPNLDEIGRGSRKRFRTHYQVAASFYLVMYFLSMFPILMNLKYVFRSEMNILTASLLVNIALLSITAVLLAPRIFRRYKHKEPLISDEFARAGTFALNIGKFFIWIGTIGVLLSLILILFVLVTRTAGIPAGIGIGKSMWPLMIGIFIVEISQRHWTRKNRKQLGQNKSRVVADHE